MRFGFTKKKPGFECSTEDPATVHGEDCGCEDGANLCFEGRKPRRPDEANPADDQELLGWDAFFAQKH